MGDPLDPRDQPEMRALGRELREAVGGALRSDAEEAERLAALRARRNRTLVDLAGELAVRGDRVSATLRDVTLTGEVVWSAGDLLRLVTPGGPVDVSTVALRTLRVVEYGGAGARPTDDGPPSFKARLRELEMDGTPVLLGVGGDELRGHITAVAVDHLLLSDVAGTETAVSLSSVTRVRAVPPPDLPGPPR